MYQGVIFDLDGVIVSTDECHYKSWKQIADREGIYFDRTINMRLRGVSRYESLDIMLERAEKAYTSEQKQQMADDKNAIYRTLLDDLSPADILPGVMDLLSALKAKGIKIAIGSSSRNTALILQKIGLDKTFDAVADGTMIQNSKPHPEVFLLAAKMLNLDPTACVVIEDAEAGIEAALAANCRAIAVGAAHPNAQAALSAADLTAVTTDGILGQDKSIQ